MIKMAKKAKGEQIRIYAKKERVGWIIPVAGYGRFQPTDEKEYLDLPAEATKIALSINGIIVKKLDGKGNEIDINEEVDENG